MTTLPNATIEDIVRRLTGTPYTKTAETAIADSMGKVGNVIRALDAAIDDGFVTVVETRDTTYRKAVRFVALTPGIAYCKTCVDGCHCEAGGAKSCGCSGCWGPNATNDCAGVAYSKASQHPTLFTVAEAVDGKTFGEAMAGSR